MPGQGTEWVIGGFTLSLNVLIPAVVIPGILFTAAGAYPFIEAVRDGRQARAPRARPPAQPPVPHRVRCRDPHGLLHPRPGRVERPHRRALLPVAQRPHPGLPLPVLRRRRSSRSGSRSGSAWACSARTASWCCTGTRPGASSGSRTASTSRSTSRSTSTSAGCGSATSPSVRWRSPGRWTRAGCAARATAPTGCGSACPGSSSRTGSSPSPRPSSPRRTRTASTTPSRPATTTPVREARGLRDRRRASARGARGRLGSRRATLTGVAGS